MHQRDNPYSPPAAVSTQPVATGPVPSYAWYFAGGTVTGLLSCGVFEMGVNRFVQDLTNNPFELLNVIGGALAIGLVIGWLSRDRRQAANPDAAKFVRLFAGVLMGVSPVYFQDLLDLLLQAFSIRVTVQLSLIRFIATILMAIVAALLTERMLRRLVLRHCAPTHASAPSPTASYDGERSPS